MKSARYLMVVCGLLCLSLFANAAEQADRQANERKAEYLFLEAMIKQTEDDNASFYDLIKRAYELDPENSIIAYYYGYASVIMDNASKKTLDFGVGLMKKHFEEHPGDFYENYIYAVICNRIGKKDDALTAWEKLLQMYPSKVQLYPLIADGYAGKGDFKKAIAAYDSLERSEGHSTAITVRKIGYLFALSDTVAAINEGRTLLNTAPENLSYNMLMGDIFLQVNRTDSAMSYYDKAQKIDPENGYVNLSKANVYNQLGDSLNYEKQVTAAIVNKDIDVKTKIDILTGYIRQSIHDNDSSARVDNMFKIVLEQHPHEADILKLYCDYLSFKQDYKNAAEKLSYALDINPTDVDSWKRLMWLYIYQKENKKAIEAGEKALSYNPDELDVYMAMSSAYFQDEDYGKTIETCQLVLDKNKTLKAVNESDVYSQMAEAYNKLNDFDKAYECYERAIAISPNNYLALNNYAYSLCIRGKDLEKAERMSKEAVDGDPDNVSYLDTYAWICFLKRDYKQALEYMKRALDGADGEEDSSAEMFEHYGDILFMNGDPDGALVEWKKALKLNPDSKLLKRKVDNKTYFYE